jgi:HAD superfamily hydrolase (TIGR01509 family)
MELMLSALHLREEFEVVVLGEECERAKPYPDPYLVAAKKLGLQPSDPVIVIEDSPSGVDELHAHAIQS